MYVHNLYVVKYGVVQSIDRSKFIANFRISTIR